MFRRAEHRVAIGLRQQDDGEVTSIYPGLAPDLIAIAEALHAAESTGVPVPTPSDSLELSLADAYAVQRLNIARRLEAGEKAVGHKVGLTSLAMQQSLGVDQPDFGVVTDAMILPEGGSLDASLLIAPRVEAEFAFRFGQDLPPSPTREQLLEAIDGVALALEVIDSRVADWKITLVDTVADNASCARIVHGDVVPATAELLDRLPAAVIRMFRNEEEAAAGPGEAVMGHPVHALEWLAGAIGAFGDHFSAGDIVLAGAVAAAVPVFIGDEVTARAEGLPSVGMRVTGSKEER